MGHNWNQSLTSNNDHLASNNKDTRTLRKCSEEARPSVTPGYRYLLASKSVMEAKRRHYSPSHKDLFWS